MKFRPPAMIRYWIRWLSLLEFVGLPMLLAIWTPTVTSPEDYGIAVLSMGTLLAFCFFVEYFAFWKKHFATLCITETDIIWRCPFCITRVMRIEDCLEVGSYLENKDNGIPKEMVYFSDHKSTQSEIIKKGVNRGVLPASKHVIKYWYSDELRRYISNEFLKVRAKEKRMYCFLHKRGE